MEEHGLELALRGAAGPRSRRGMPLLALHGGAYLTWWRNESCLLVVLPSAFSWSVRCVGTAGLAHPGFALGC